MKNNSFKFEHHILLNFNIIFNFNETKSSKKMNIHICYHNYIIYVCILSYLRYYPKNKIENIYYLHEIDVFLRLWYKYHKLSPLSKTSELKIFSYVWKVLFEACTTACNVSISCYLLILLNFNLFFLKINNG